VVECPEDFGRFIGHTFSTKTSGSDKITTFKVEDVVHSSRRGPQIYIVYADADQAVLSAKESDEVVDTVTEWTNDF
jgi:hypothetical protein